MFDVPQPDQIAQQPGIREVDLGGFHQPFTDIGVIRPQDKDLETCLQDRDPILGCVDRYPDIPGQVAQVKDLRAARGAGAEGTFWAVCG